MLLLIEVMAVLVILACTLYICRWLVGVLLVALHLVWRMFCAFARFADRQICRLTGDKPLDEARIWATHVPANKAREADLNHDTEHA